ncbi:MAG: class I SAM-dependent methyltransferase [Gemmataceae bacterium]|nr:class I SAM-dependent methyltransferase [Gemmataceae bacterium]MCI0742854.1 class I SAM-dependent methyltransferase [Gemmataceae bacterium]
MRRLLRNLLRLPARTFSGLRQFSNPVHRLQRRAERCVATWFAPDLRKKLENINGFSSAREVQLLAYFASLAPVAVDPLTSDPSRLQERRATRLGCIVEIGAFKGRSTAYLAEGAQRNPLRPAVVSIDPHLRDTWDDFQGTVAEFGLRERGLEVIRGFSADVGRTWRRPIGLLWVDGCHEYAEVCQDIDLFTPHVLPGGWVVFDDAHGGHFPGVEKAVTEKMMHNSAFRHVGTIKHFDVFQR